MNVRLRKTYAWNSGLVLDGNFLINSYDCVIDMITVSTDADLHNIAYHRMNYWIYEIMQDSVLMPKGDKLIAAYQATGQRVIEIPQQPIDQLLGMMLFVKLNAIMEGQIRVTDLAISSAAGDHMAYAHSEHETIGPFAESGWWSDARPKWSDAKSTRSNSKVIAINRTKEWKDLDLDWSQSAPDSDQGVVFARFRPDEDQ